MNVPLRNRKGSFARNLLEQNPDLWYSLNTLSLEGTWLFEIAWEVVNKGLNLLTNFRLRELFKM